MELATASGIDVVTRLAYGRTVRGWAVPLGHLLDSRAAGAGAIWVTRESLVPVSLSRVAKRRNWDRVRRERALRERGALPHWWSTWSPSLASLFAAVGERGSFITKGDAWRALGALPRFRPRDTSGPASEQQLQRLNRQGRLRIRQPPT